MTFSFSCTACQFCFRVCSELQTPPSIALLWVAKKGSQRLQHAQSFASPGIDYHPCFTAGPASLGTAALGPYYPGFSVARLLWPPPRTGQRLFSASRALPRARGLLALAQLVALGSHSLAAHSTEFWHGTHAARPLGLLPRPAFRYLASSSSRSARLCTYLQLEALGLLLFQHCMQRGFVSFCSFLLPVSSYRSLAPAMLCPWS